MNSDKNQSEPEAESAERSSEQATVVRDLGTLAEGLWRIADKPCLCGHRYQRFARAGRRQPDGSWMTTSGVEVLDRCPRCKRPNVLVTALAEVEDSAKRKLVMRNLIDRLPPATARPAPKPARKATQPPKPPTRGKHSWLR